MNNNKIIKSGWADPSAYRDAIVWIDEMSTIHNILQFEIYPAPSMIYAVILVGKDKVVGRPKGTSKPKPKPKPKPITKTQK